MGSNPLNQIYSHVIPTLMIGYWRAIFSLFSLALADPASDGARFERESLDREFLRGNTHTHSNRSDGDSSPETLIRLYRDAGYAFLVLTDHNRASRPGEFAALESPGRFAVLAGEEVTSGARPSNAPANGPHSPVHVNSICARATVGGRMLPTVRATLADAVSRIRGGGGLLAQVDHPNYYWALSAADVAAVAGHATGGAALLEIANQHPLVRNEGDARHPSTEAIWDRVLSEGKRIYGVASDDSHHLKPREGRRALPLQGWVQVSASAHEPARTPEAIYAALAAGRFYSSTGISLASIRVAGDELELAVAGAPADEVGTEFVGRGGQVLARQNGLHASYTLQGTETYVRARVCGKPHAGGRPNCAWTQPEFVTRGSSD